MDDTNRKELLLWAEKAAIESLKGHHASADVIAKEASTTLTIFLAAMGGGIAYALKLLEAGEWKWQAAGCAFFTVWFLVLSVLLVGKCLMIRAIPPVFNEPSNLYMPQFAYLDVIESELDGFQRRIAAVGKENGRVVWWLNRLRMAAALSPVATALALWVGWWKVGA